MEKLKDQCRLCNSAGPGVVNIFDDVLNSQGDTYVVQIEEMFQLALEDMPDWPKGCCSECAEFMEQMKRFKQIIIERHCSLQEATESLPEHPIEDVFFVEPAYNKLEESKAVEEDILTEEVRVDVQKAVREDREKRPKTRRCNLCKIQFSTAAELASHCRIEHHDEEVKLEELMRERQLLKCHLCTEQADQEEDLKMLAHHYTDEHQMKQGGLYCCGRFYVGRRSAFDHMRYHLDPDKFKCFKCDKRFPNSGRLTFHNDIYHSQSDGPSGFVCKTCGRSFHHKIPYRKHIQTVHLSEVDKRHKCSYCNKAFAHSSNLKKHVSRLHEKVFSHTCDICGLAFPDPEYLEGHVKRAHGERKPRAARKLKAPKAIRTLGGEDDKLEQCGICEKFYVNLAQHNSKVHKVLRMPRYKWGERKQFCDKCGNYISHPNFTAHHSRCGKATTKVPQRMKCTLCDKVFSSEQGFKLHNFHVHKKRNQREVACPYCNFKSVSKGNRWRHIRYSHPAEFENLNVYAKEAGQDDGDDEPGQQSEHDAGDTAE